MADRRPAHRLTAGYREIDHTADLAYEVWARSWEELVAAATRGLCALVTDPTTVEARQRRRIEVGGRDREELLVRWLHEVYLALETDGWLTAAVERVESDAGRLAGVLAGEPLDRARHPIHTEIKAITYHRLRLAEDGDGYLRTQIIVDV